MAVDHRLKMLRLGFLHSLQACACELWLPVLYMYEISECVSASLSVSCAFPVALFLLFVLPSSGLFVFVLYYFTLL